MKYKATVFLLLTALLFSASACSIIGDIFKAGMGVGIFLVVVVVAIIIFIIVKVRKRK